jgi:hypothetical protein
VLVPLSQEHDCGMALYTNMIMLYYYIMFKILNYMYTFTTYIFLAYFGHTFFSLFSIIWGHSVAASC